MTDRTPHTTGETFDQLLERVIFADPATHPIRDRWEETKRTEQEAFNRVCREEYEQRLKYHRICQSPDPEGTARRETNLCMPLFREELDQRLAERWAETLRRVRAVLMNRTAEVEDGAQDRDTGDGMGQ